VADDGIDRAVDPAARTNVQSAEDPGAVVEFMG
jgi:hypothetical protein